MVIRRKFCDFRVYVWISKTIREYFKHIKLKLLKEMINKKKMEESIGKVCFWQSKEINI